MYLCKQNKHDMKNKLLKGINGLLILLTLIIVSCSKDEDIIDFPNENAVGANNSEVGVEEGKYNHLEELLNRRDWDGIYNIYPIEEVEKTTRRK